MNQILRLTNLTNGVINLSGQYYTILPRKFIEVLHMEVPNLMPRIRLFQHRGWISASYVSEGGKEELLTFTVGMTQAADSPEDEYVRSTLEEKEVIGAYEDSDFSSVGQSSKPSVNPIINKNKNFMNGQKDKI